VSDDIDDPNLKARIASENEQRKLDATFLNNTGIGLFLAGVAAPTLAYFYDLSTKPGVAPGAVLGGAAFWAAVAGILNYLGKGRLEKIR
jgi:hypothetical protein